MELKENVLFNELVEIFDGNNQDYIRDKDCIFIDKFEKIVAVENNHALGYAVLYFGNDFIEQEGYDVECEVKGKSIYIWNCVTKKGCENKGVQSTIFKYFINKYPDYDIYSVNDIINEPTKRLHSKMEFIPIAEFSKIYEGKLSNYILVKKSRMKN